MSDILGTLGTVLEVLDTIDADQSTIITVSNETDVTLHLIEEEDNHESGEFATLPAGTIPPGEEDVFASREKSPSFFTGDVGHVSYRVGDTDTAFLRVNWSNPQVGDPFSGEDANQASAPLGGSDAANFETSARINPSGSEKVPARFEVRQVGGGGGGGGQPPPPRPEEDIKSTCVITVTNQTDVVLTLADQGHEIGGFFTFPALQLEPGESDQFASVESEGSQTKGTRGFLVYNAGEIGSCQWTVTWDNPEQADNSSTSTLTGPAAAGFSAVDQIGTGEENVPVTFTIFGSGGGGGGEPVVEPFVAPVEADEPTLRLGDQTVDGWVEYAQNLLNAWGVGPLTVNGDFDNAMHQAVFAFQRAHGLQVDGTIGNQTWAALREEDPRPPSTDGREPHSFVEQGAEARWITEDHGVQYDAAQDVLFVQAFSTGSTPINNGEFVATIFVTPPDGEQLRFDVPGDTPAGQPAQPGDQIVFRLHEARQNRGPGTYQVDAFLPQELGGDRSTRNIEII